MWNLIEDLKYGKIREKIVVCFLNQNIFTDDHLKLYSNEKKQVDFRNNEIIGDYPYSGVLDDGLFPNPPKAGTGKTTQGYSTQAKQGMAKPTIKELTKQFNAFVRKT